MADSNATKESPNCTASIATDSIVDAVSFITGVLFHDQKTKFQPNSASAPAEFEFQNPAKFGSGRI